MANTMINPAIYSKKWLRNYDLATVMADLVNTTYQGDMANAGDIMHAQQLPNITINTYSPGTDITPQSVTITDQTISVNQKKAAMVYIDETEIKQTHLPIINGLMKRFSVAFANTIDDRLLGHYADVNAANVIGSDAAPITVTPANVYDYFVQAGEIMLASGIPPEGLVAVVDEKVKSACLRSPDFVKATATGDQVVRKGQIGELAGFKVVVTPRIATVSGVRNQMFFHPDFIELIVQLDADRLLKVGDAEKQVAKYIRSAALYGSGVLQNTAGVVLKRAA
jgi:hypothetical protein